MRTSGQRDGPDGSACLRLPPLPSSGAAPSEERRPIMLRRDLANNLRRETRLGPLVLIADDSPTVRVVTRHALERAGLQTLEVATPLEVIAAAGEVFPDIFVLDITFAAGAQADGYRLCRA